MCKSINVLFVLFMFGCGETPAFMRPDADESQQLPDSSQMMMTMVDASIVDDRNETSTTVQETGTTSDIGAVISDSGNDASFAVDGNGDSSVTVSGNLALGRAASQSSTYTSGRCVRRAEKAVNGASVCEDSCEGISHTDRELSPWWEVDLGANYNIRYLLVYGWNWGTTDNVFIEVRHPVDDTITTITRINVHILGNLVLVPIQLPGRYVRIQRTMNPMCASTMANLNDCSISLCEVQVMARPL